MVLDFVVAAAGHSLAELLRTLAELVAELVGLLLRPAAAAAVEPSQILEWLPMLLLGLVASASALPAVVAFEPPLLEGRLLSPSLVVVALLVVAAAVVAVAAVLLISLLPPYRPRVVSPRSDKRFSSSP